MTECFYAIKYPFFRDVNYYRKVIYTEEDILNYFSSEKLKNCKTGQIKLKQVIANGQ